MSDEFNYRLQRSRTRESSILTIAAIASSASLVLLVLLIQAQVQVESSEGGYSDSLDRYTLLIQIMGIMFALVGILYRDVTALSVQRNDECFIRQKVKDCDLKSLRTSSRAAVLHILLLMPIGFWLIVIHPTIDGITITITVFVGIYIWIISSFEATDPCMPTKQALKRTIRCAKKGI